MGFKSELAKGYLAEAYKNRSVWECSLRTPQGLVERIPLRFKKGNNTIDYLSVSRIEAFSECPSMFKQVFMDRTLDTSSIFSDRGTIYHAVCERIGKHFIETGEQLDVDEIFDEEWGKGNISDFNEYNEMKGLVRKFWKTINLKTEQWEIIACEKEFLFYLSDGTAISGIIDVIARDRKNPKCYWILDYKSNYLPFTNVELRNSLQFRTYSIALKEMYDDVEDIGCCYLMLRHERQMTPHFSQQDLDDTLHFLECASKQIKAETEFSPKLNNYCCYRDCRFTCPKYQQMMKMQEEMGFDNIYEEREHYYALEKNANAKRKELDKQIKTEIEEQKGCVDAPNGKTYSINPIKRGVLDYNVVYKALLAINRLDLLNGFNDIKEPEAFLRMINVLDDSKYFLLKMQIMSAYRVTFNTSSVTRKRTQK